mmetsp:Transcript_42903/g.121289  ORF Transcript_42903/g.121289 Transcript_42903/m.121289 type:complete len:269 (-) Transcript_42903:87-893(-)
MPQMSSFSCCFGRRPALASEPDGEWCLVCFERVERRMPLGPLRTRNGDTIRTGEDCGHPVCSPCLAKYVAARVEALRVHDVPCPAPGCERRLFVADVDHLVARGDLEAGVRDRFVEIRSRDFGARADEFSNTMSRSLGHEDYDLLKRLWSTTRLCPRCRVVIERSKGCNSFYCICGHHFDFQSAPRVVGNGVRGFCSKVEMAQSLQIPVSVAVLCRKERQCSRVVSLASALGLTVDEAGDLQRRARSGDEAAREAIRTSRRAAQAEEC